MLRLHVPAAPAADGTIVISAGERRHLGTLRLGPGDRFLVFDGQGTEHEVVLETLDRRTALARVVATRKPERESALDLVLAPALLKGAKMDLVVEKATELGVTRIAPILTRHTIGHRADAARWQRIALAAAKQSGRTRVPAIDPVVPLGQLLAVAWPGLRLIAWEGETTRRWNALPAAAAAVVAVVGPEGGFAPDEVGAAEAHGFLPVRLGARVLRAETATIVVAALCQHRFGDA
ncbi:MAG: 16S rRNA (uracil(1498)-N(3))-methyltransferase [Candidatus Binatia bacterium]